MNLPGFTADASLYQTTNRYNMTGDSRNLRSGEGVIPQARVLDCFCLPSGRYCCCRAEGRWTCGASTST
jgi:hypothetical protein